MKNIITSFVITFCFLQACSQSNTNTTSAENPSAIPVQSTTPDTIDPPQEVLDKFQHLFPGTQQVEWEMEEDKYEATFNDANGEKSVLFAANGDVLVSESSIQLNSLPEGVIDYIARDLKNKKVDHAQMVITTSGTITYQIEVEGKNYIFSGEGKFQKMEVAEQGEKD